MAESVIRETLQRLKRRLLVIDGLSSAVKALLAAFAVLVLAIWCDLLLDLSPTLRVVAWVIAGLSLCITLALLLRVATARSAPDRMASRLDDAAKANGQIRTGVDLALSSNGMKSNAPELTQGLSSLAIDRAASLAKDVAPANVVPARGLVRTIIAVAGIGVLTALLVMLMPNVAHTQWLRFTQPFSDHPPWTRLKIQVEPGDTEVVYGAGVELSASLSEPTNERVELVFVPDDSSATEDALPMFPEPNGNWRASIASVTTPAVYYVRCGRAESRRYRVDVITVPNIETVSVTVTPPEYTRETAFEGEVPENGIMGLAGTKVRFNIRSNRPLGGGRLVFEDTEGQTEYPLTVNANDQANAFVELDLKTSGRVEIGVTDSDGQDSTDVFRSAFTLLTDHAPMVRLLQPRSNSFATAAATIPVVVAAEDDYGVATVQVFRSLNQSRYLPVDLQVAEPPERMQRVGIRLPLAAYGLQPGDEIRLFARVVDNNPAEARASESNVVSIQIVAESEMRKMRRTRDGMRELQSRYEQARRRMESVAAEMKRLQEELAKAPSDSKLSEELKKQIQELMAKMANEANQLRRLEKSPLPYDLDKQLSPRLGQMASQLDELQKLLAALADNPETKAGDAAEQLEDLTVRLQKKRKKLKEETNDLVDLLAVLLPFKQAEAQFVRLYQAQASLAERMQALNGRDGEDNPELKVRMRELEEEQEALRQKLMALEDSIQANIDRLPDDERLAELRTSAEEFLEKLRWSGADVEMHGAAQALAEFEGTSAYEQAVKAKEILEQLISMNQGMGQAAGESAPKFSPSFSPSMNQTMQQLLRDAGLGGNPGQSGMAGGGAGGGFSARRSTMQNVGLYSNEPTLSDAAQRGGQSDKTAVGQAGVLPGTEAVVPSAVYDTTSALRSVNSDTSTIPLQYRRRVSRYFQRLADKLEDD